MFTFWAKNRIIDGNLSTRDLSAAADLTGEEGRGQRRRLRGVDIIAHMLGQ